MKFGIFGCAMLGGVIALSACGDDVTKVTNVTNEVSGMEIAASADSLGKCEEENFGKTVFVSDENTAYICADSAWKKLLPASEKKSSCKVQALSDSSGFKIVCDGDSVGAILNEQEPGCSLSDGGNGTLVQVCGDDSTTFHVALCGDVPYKTDSEFCYENAVYAKCGEKIYSVGKDLCLDEEVYKNKAYVWNLMNPEIEYDIFTDVRDSQVYRTVKIGEQVWMAENLNFDYSAGTGNSCLGYLDENCDKFGRAYSWSSAMDSAAVYGKSGKDCGNGVVCEKADVVRGVCPEGFHLPDTTEWNLLVKFVQEEMKDTSSRKTFKALSSKAFDGTDDFGFGGLIAGLNGGIAALSYYKSFAVFLTSVENDEIRSYTMIMSNQEEMMELDSFNKEPEISIRCIKD